MKHLGDLRDADLRLAGVTKRFGSFDAVDNVTFTVSQGSFFALLGPSGCGKTTTLRMVAGLERPTAGSIVLGDDDITDVRPYKRPVNTVFQSYALFPHLAVFENVAFGLRRRGVKEIRAQVAEMLELVELSGLERRRPAQLSGGQQQRVALARALINHPAVLLLDEPLGALDLKLRRQMQSELKRIQTEVGTTFVHVTHDQEEAMSLADTIAVMNAGRIEQLGTPAQLYESPSSTFVANFVGQSNLIRSRVVQRSEQDLVATAHGHRLVIPAARAITADVDVWIGIRPEKIHIEKAAGDGGTVADGLNHIPGIVTTASFAGVSTQYVVRVPWGQELTVFAQNIGSAEFRPGDRVMLAWQPAHGFGLDATQDADAGAAPQPDRDPQPATAGQ